MPGFEQQVEGTGEELDAASTVYNELRSASQIELLLKLSVRFATIEARLTALEHEQVGLRSELIG